MVTTLVTKRENIPVYDATFRRYFLDGPAEPVADLLMLKARLTTDEAVLNVPLTDPEGEGHEEEAVLGWMASDVESLKRKSFAACSSASAARISGR